MDSVHNAIAYIEAHGNELELARLHYMLHDQPADESTLTELAMNRRPDGSWSPFWSKDYSSLDATCYKLAQLEQIGHSHHPMAEQAIAFLASRQGPEGDFEEAWAMIDNCPPWVKPGNPQARLYLTANCAFWLAYHHPHSPACIAAASWLRMRINEQGGLDSYYHTNWLCAGVFLLLGWTEESNQVLRYLNHSYHELSADNVAWMANTLLIAGSSKQDELLKRLVVRLAAMQAEDGYWESDDGDWQRIHTSLEALRTILYVQSSSAE